jgi:VIT1/CCC1 family predicted Fe2+/Mn2+ transporter
MNVLDAENAVFGGFDGLTTGIGVAAALVLSHHSSKSVVVAVLAAALAAAVGMGAGKWLSDSDEGFREASVMFLATSVGGFLPAAPFLFLAASKAFAVALVVCALLGAAIGRLRGGRRRQYAETYGVLAVVVALTVAVGVFAGAN